MNTALTVHQIQGADGSFELRVSGEIDLSNVEVFSAALDAALPADDDILIVDLTAVNYLDSAAINASAGLTTSESSPTRYSTPFSRSVALLT